MTNRTKAAVTVGGLGLVALVLVIVRCVLEALGK